MYNAEYVKITDSSFSNIGKALLSIYRGGTDESTFGPHVEIRNSEISTVGKNKRNKTVASVHLHGIQVVWGGEVGAAAQPTQPCPDEPGISVGANPNAPLRAPLRPISAV